MVIGDGEVAIDEEGRAERGLAPARRELDADLQQLAARGFENPLRRRGDRRCPGCVGSGRTVLRRRRPSPAQHRHRNQQSNDKPRGEHHLGADFGGIAAGRKRLACQPIEPRLEAFETWGGTNGRSSAQHRDASECALAAGARREDQAGRHRSPRHQCPSLRDFLAPAQVRRVRRFRDVDVVADDPAGRRAIAIGWRCRCSRRGASSTPACGRATTAASDRRPICAASGSACRNTSRPRRSGRAAR